jgi:perosamine synthetase
MMTMEERIERMSIPINATIRDAMRAIDRGVIGLALLVHPEDRSFEGLVTDGDLRRALLNGMGLEAPVNEVPRPDPKVASITDTSEDIALMFSEKIRWIPILDQRQRVVNMALYDRRLHLPVAHPFLGEKELEYVSECVLTSWISSAGKFVTQFEEIFADFCGAKYAVSTSNGTCALHLALIAEGIGTGDEVIVPALTFIATANAVTYTGAKPIFVDSDRFTWNIDPGKIETAITSKTKAIIPVHLYGHPAEMNSILAIADKYGLSVIEDAAEAHGARYRGVRVGTIGKCGCFSFYGNKIFTTGEGGMVVTNDKKLAQKIRILRDHGMDPGKKYRHNVLGYNYRITNLQAAIGVAQIEKADAILEKKRQIAQIYKENLTDIEGIELPPEFDWAVNVNWLYSILVHADQFGIDRDELIEELHHEGIDTRPFFYPVHLQPIYNTGQRLEIAEELSMSGLSLPSGVNLINSDVVRIAETIQKIHKKYKK